MEENKEQPFVTVFIPVYNPPIDRFRKCIESVLNQTYTNFELLLLDDGSDNGCFEAASDLVESDERIKVYHLAHNFTTTLNYGLSIAKGKYLIRHDSDDEMFPTRIEDQVTVMETDPEVGLCIGNLTILPGNYLYNSSGTDLNISSDKVREDLNNWVYSHQWSGGVMCFRTETVKKNKIKYNKHYIAEDDFCMLIDFAFVNCNIYWMSKPVIWYTPRGSVQGEALKHKDQLSGKDYFYERYNAKNQKKYIIHWIIGATAKYLENAILPMKSLFNLLPADKFTFRMTVITNFDNKKFKEVKQVADEILNNFEKYNIFEIEFKDCPDFPWPVIALYKPFLCKKYIKNDDDFVFCGNAGVTIEENDYSWFEPNKIILSHHIDKCIVDNYINTGFVLANQANMDLLCNEWQKRINKYCQHDFKIPIWHDETVLNEILYNTDKFKNQVSKKNILYFCENLKRPGSFIFLENKLHSDAFKTCF